MFTGIIEAVGDGVTESELVDLIAELFCGGDQLGGDGSFFGHEIASALEGVGEVFQAAISSSGRLIASILEIDQCVGADADLVS